MDIKSGSKIIRATRIVLVEAVTVLYYYTGHLAFEVAEHVNSNELMPYPNAIFWGQICIWVVLFLIDLSTLMTTFLFQTRWG